MSTATTTSASAAPDAEKQAARPLTFSDIVDAAEALSADEKENLVDFLQHRLLADRREQIKRDIEATRREFEAGDYETLSPAEIMERVRS